MANSGQLIGRSFVVGYSASAGHSAWCATKKHAPAILVLSVAFVLAAAPLFFVYKSAKAAFAPTDDKASRILLFGTGAVLSVMYLGWALYWSSFFVSSFIHPARLPGYDLVPKQAVTAVYQNTIHSMVRSSLLVGKLLGRTAEDGEVTSVDLMPNENNPDLMATLNLVARLYFLAATLGVAAGLRQRSQLG